MLGQRGRVRSRRTEQQERWMSGELYLEADDGLVKIV